MSSSGPGRLARALVRGGCCAAALVGGAAFAQWIEAETPASWATTTEAGMLAGPRVRVPSYGDEGAPENRTEPQTSGARDAEAAPAPAPHEGALGRRFRGGKIITGATPHRLILFTFDDGPDVRHTRELLDVLDRLGIKAVFFVTAQRISPHHPWGREHAAIASEIAARGHLIGNHTVEHVQLPLLDDEAVKDELRRSERIFREVLGERPWLLRPPGGARSARTDRLVGRRGYTQVMWNLGAGDADARTAREVVETWTRKLDRRARKEGEKGGIVLLHDTHSWSVKAVPRIVETIRERNCRLLERGKELYDIVDDPRLFFAARDGAPYDTEAPPADPPREAVARRQAELRVETAQRCSGSP